MSRAVVCAGGIDTCYVRAGRGKPVVMVSENMDAPGVQEMIATLARDHLVLAAAPQLSDMRELGVWLRNFVEGLGIVDAHVILHASISTILMFGDSSHV
jgi:hypothetical protein